jgi:hypothetical protein
MAVYHPTFRDPKNKRDAKTPWLVVGVHLRRTMHTGVRTELAKYLNEHLEKGVSEDLLCAANKELERLARRDRDDCNRD